MLDTPTIRQFDAGPSHVYAFRVLDRVRSEDLSEMAGVMNDAFDRHDTLDMLVVFEGGAGSEAGAGLDPEVLTSQVRSLANVRHYVVVAAPDAAARMVEAMGKLIPVDARTFEREDAALAFLRGAPAPA